MNKYQKELFCSGGCHTDLTYIFLQDNLIANSTVPGDGIPGKLPTEELEKKLLQAKIEAQQKEAEADARWLQQEEGKLVMLIAYN